MNCPNVLLEGNYETAAWALDNGQSFSAMARLPFQISPDSLPDGSLLKITGIEGADDNMADNMFYGDGLPWVHVAAATSNNPLNYLPPKFWLKISNLNPANSLPGTVYCARTLISPTALPSTGFDIQALVKTMSCDSSQGVPDGKEFFATVEAANLDGSLYSPIGQSPYRFTWKGQDYSSYIVTWTTGQPLRVVAPFPGEQPLQLQVPLMLNKPAPAGGITVQIEAEDGYALVDQDFTVSNRIPGTIVRTVTFAQGSTTANYPITVLPDTAGEVYNFQSGTNPPAETVDLNIVYYNQFPGTPGVNVSTPPNTRSLQIAPALMNADQRFSRFAVSGVGGGSDSNFSDSYLEDSSVSPSFRITRTPGQTKELARYYRIEVSSNSGVTCPATVMMAVGDVQSYVTVPSGCNGPLLQGEQYTAKVWAATSATDMSDVTRPADNFPYSFTVLFNSNRGVIIGVRGPLNGGSDTIEIDNMLGAPDKQPVFALLPAAGDTRPFANLYRVDVFTSTNMTTPVCRGDTTLETRTRPTDNVTVRYAKSLNGSQDCNLAPGNYLARIGAIRGYASGSPVLTWVPQDPFPFTVQDPQSVTINAILMVEREDKALGPLRLVEDGKSSRFVITNYVNGMPTNPIVPYDISLGIQGLAPTGMIFNAPDGNSASDVRFKINGVYTDSFRMPTSQSSVVLEIESPEDAFVETDKLGRILIRKAVPVAPPSNLRLNSSSMLEVSVLEATIRPSLVLRLGGPSVFEGESSFISASYSGAGVYLPIEVDVELMPAKAHTSATLGTDVSLSPTLDVRQATIRWNGGISWDGKVTITEVSKGKKPRLIVYPAGTRSSFPAEV
jgi:hypothetical protein